MTAFRASDARRQAVTLVELLVAIAIVAVLIAIAIPAVQRVRESARQIQCQNNLRQLGIACASHEAAMQTYPPGFVVKPRQHNFVQYLLPYFEQNAVFERYEFECDWNSDRNSNAVQQELKVMRCPSAPVGSRFAADYAVCVQVHSDAVAMLTSQGLLHRARNTYVGLLREHPTRTADVIDGLSNTILLSEDAGRPERYQFGRYRGGLEVTGSPWATPDGRFDVNMVCGGGEFGRGGQMMNCTNNNELYSFHPTGAEFLYADGSTKFVGEKIDPDVLISLLTSDAAD